MTTQCSGWSYDSRISWRCSRPVKAEGMCAQHLAGKKRREANRLKEDEERAAADAEMAAAESKTARLAELGITAYLQTSSKWPCRPTGRVTVDADALIALLEGRP